MFNLLSCLQNHVIDLFYHNPRKNTMRPGLPGEKFFAAVRPAPARPARAGRAGPGRGGATCTTGVPAGEAAGCVARAGGRRNIAILSKCSRSGMRGKRGQAFFLVGSIKPPLRKQRTGFFSQLAGNMPLKKKAPARLAAARDSKQRKSPENAFFHDKFAASSSASARVFSQNAP